MSHYHERTGHVAAAGLDPRPVLRGARPRERRRVGDGLGSRHARGVPAAIPPVLERAPASFAGLRRTRQPEVGGRRAEAHTLGIEDLERDRGLGVERAEIIIVEGKTSL